MVNWVRSEAPMVLATGSTCSSTSASVANSTVGSAVYGPYFTAVINASTANSSNIYIDTSTTATTNSYAVHAGETAGPFLVKDVFSVISDTTTQRFYFKILNHA